MQKDIKRFYLEQMGIETWVERQDSCERALSMLATKVATCSLCPLHITRSQTVFARGNSAAKIMLVGEAPGFFEDKQGLPFVGKAGELLNKMLFSVGLSEQDVYIANVLKCRPPENRDPDLNEIKQCGQYLSEQITLIKPSLLLALGQFASQFLTNQSLSLNQLRESLFHYEDIPCMVSYHPAYLLRNPKDKKKAYQDLQKVRRFLMV